MKINTILVGKTKSIQDKSSLKTIKNYGFTIVELLVTIVIIAVLATIVTVSYRGITSKASEAALTADLTNASKKLSMYYAEYGTYPDDLDNTTGCPTGPHLDTNYCIKLGNNTSFDYTLKTPSTYDLTFTKGTLSYQVTESKPPFNVTKTPITAIAAISGTPQTSQTLTAGTITPAGATVSYQWQSATTAGGTYNNINGATASTYAVSPATIGKYIKVTVTGTGTYAGTQISAASAQVAADANWLTIGSQTWAKANLNVGTRIAGASAQTNNATTEKYCNADTESNCTSGGGLYQWDEAMNYNTAESAQGICPIGSHIPSDNEWKTLEMSLGMTQAEADKSTDWRGTDQGTKLKSGGTSGLNVPLAGYRSTAGTFYYLSSNDYLWSSSESAENAWYRMLGSSNANIFRNEFPKAHGFSVRCLGN